MRRTSLSGAATRRMRRRIPSSWHRSLGVAPPRSLSGHVVIAAGSFANRQRESEARSRSAMALLLLAFGIAWCWNTQVCQAGQPRPPICIKLLAAVADEARYCGFFCDQDRIRLLQRDYETACIKSTLPPAPFDIDSASLNAAQPEKSEIRAEASPSSPLYSK